MRYTLFASAPDSILFPRLKLSPNSKFTIEQTGSVR